MSKYVVTGISLEQFAEKYPHLVRTKVVLDTRRITSSLQAGWKIPEVTETEGNDDDEEATGKPAGKPAKKARFWRTERSP